MSERVSDIDKRLAQIEIKEQSTVSEQLSILLAQERLALTKERILLTSPTPGIISPFSHFHQNILYLIWFPGPRRRDAADHGRYICIFRSSAAPRRSLKYVLVSYNFAKPQMLFTHECFFLNIADAVDAVSLQNLNFAIRILLSSNPPPSSTFKSIYLFSY